MGVQNFINAGSAAANNAVKNVAALRRNAPKYEEIGKQSIKERADMQAEAMKTDASVVNQGMKQFANVKQVANDEKARAKIRDVQGQARKAGVLAQVVATGAMLPGMLKKKESDNSISQLMAKRLDELKGRKGRPDPSLKEGDDPVLKDLQDQLDELNGKTYGNTGATDNTDGGGTTPKPMKSSGNLKMDYMTKLTGAGMSDVQAAATVGHMMVETGGFKHMEELAPNVHGTKGYGHMQWTDPSPGNGRRTNFMNWSKDNGLDPQSFEANSGFLIHELTTNHGQVWTGGGSFDGLKGQNTLEGASSYLQSNFIRPGEPHTERRLSEGNTALSEWRALQGG